MKIKNKEETTFEEKSNKKTTLKEKLGKNKKHYSECQCHPKQQTKIRSNEFHILKFKV